MLSVLFLTATLFALGAADPAPIPTVVNVPVPRAFAGLVAEYSRYEFHPTRVQAVSLDLLGAVALSPRLSLFARAPFSFATLGTIPKRAGMGNLGGGLRWDDRFGSVAAGVDLSLSAPTAGERQILEYANRYTATARILRDSSFYQPGLLTARGGAFCGADGQRFVWAAHIEARQIINVDRETAQTHLATAGSVGLVLSPGFRTGLSGSATWWPGAPDDTARVITGADVWAHVQGDSWGGGAFVNVPIDRSTRRLQLFGFGFSLGRRFS